MLPMCYDKVSKYEKTLWCTHIKQIWKWRVYLLLLMPRNISLRTLPTCISWLLMHFCSINKVMKYEARISSLHRNRVLKALKTCALSNSICHKLISSYYKDYISVICFLNNCKISLVKTQFIFHYLIQQGTFLFHP